MCARAWNRWHVRARASNQGSVDKASSLVRVSSPVKVSKANRANRVRVRDSKGNPARAKRKVNKDSRARDKRKDRVRARANKVKANQGPAVAAGNPA